MVSTWHLAVICAVEKVAASGALRLKSVGVPKSKVVKHRARPSAEKDASPVDSAAQSPDTSFVPQEWLRKTGPAITMIESFYHAFHGIWIGLKEERNVRIHFSLVVLVTVLGVWLKVDAQSWISLIIAMGMVVAAEFVNTSLEHLVDISTNNEYHESAKYAKDTAAAAVLISSIAAAAIGAIVFVPKLLALLAH